MNEEPDERERQALNLPCNQVRTQTGAGPPVFTRGWDRFQGDTWGEGEGARRLDEACDGGRAEADVWLCCGAGNRTDMWRSGIQRSRCGRPSAITICTDEIRDLRVGRLLSPEAKRKNVQNKSVLEQSQADE